MAEYDAVKQWTGEASAEINVFVVPCLWAAAARREAGGLPLPPTGGATLVKGERSRHGRVRLGYPMTRILKHQCTLKSNGSTQRVFTLQ